MKLSPVDIFNKDFKKSVVRGYSIEEVDDFLEEVGMEFEKLLRDRNEIKKEKIKLSQKV